MGVLNLKSLLERGWFPRELPPPFNTGTLASAITDNLLVLPSEWLNPKLLVRPGRHNLPRYSSLRRDVTLVNPKAQVGLSREIEACWTELSMITGASQFSASSPAPTANRRAVERAAARSDLPKLRARVRVGANWIVRTDIAHFYPSIYTHSIPWALHSKDQAKRDKSARLAGNRLDTWVRKGQWGQTQGIPIGPDSSLVLAELILARVDEIIATNFPDIQMMRYMDDYELAVNSEIEAEQALNVLQKALREYELRLKWEKTRITRLPQELQRPWATRLSSFTLGTNDARADAELVSYFDLAFHLGRDYPEEPVLNFALAHLRDTQSGESADPDLRRALMLQSMLIEPGTQRYVIELLTEEPAISANEKKRVARALSEQVLRHARREHANEVAWALWACICLDVELSREAVTALTTFDDDIVALLSLDANDKQLTPDIDLSRWKQHMKASELNGEHWLLAYEAFVQHWLPALDGQDYVNLDVCFNWLREHGVTFYDSATASGVPDEMLEPEAAWDEAYSA